MNNEKWIIQTKNPSTIVNGFSFGGEQGIRTLEPRLTVTRFPIVLLRPARTTLHKHILLFAWFIIQQGRGKSNTFNPLFCLYFKEKPPHLRWSLTGADDEARTRYLHLGKVALYQMSYIRIFWCLRSESNQRHTDFQSVALPTELQRHMRIFILLHGDPERARTVDL